MSASRDRLVELGQVMGTHGIHGDLRVKSHNPDSDQLLSLREVTLVGPDGKADGRRVLDAKFHGKGLLMRLSGVTTPEQARALYGFQLAVPRDALPEPEDDEFYLVDAIGARVELTDGSSFGTVESFRAYPTADVFCVRNDRGLFEVPVLDPYFVSADIAAGVIVIDQVDDLEPEPNSK